MTIQSWSGDPTSEDSDGRVAHVLVVDRVFPVRINEWSAGDGVHTRAGSIATVYPDEATFERWRQLEHLGPDQPGA